MEVKGDEGGMGHERFILFFAPFLDTTILSKGSNASKCGVIFKFGKKYGREESLLHPSAPDFHLQSTKKIGTSEKYQ